MNKPKHETASLQIAAERRFFVQMADFYFMSFLTIYICYNLFRKSKKEKTNKHKKTRFSAFGRCHVNQGTVLRLPLKNCFCNHSSRPHD